MAGSASLAWAAAGLIGLFTVAPGIGDVVDSLVESEAGEAAIARAPDGHHYIAATVGGQPVRFLVDGGRDDVVLADADAERLGLAPNASVELSDIAIGSQRIARLTARSSPGVPVSLIGRSVLVRLGAAQASSGALILR